MPDTQQIRQVRLLIADTDPDRQVLTDTDVVDFLLLEGNVKLAAAAALDAIASSEALTSKVIRTQDLSTDGPKTAAALREHADRLRAQVGASDADGTGAEESAFSIVPTCDSCVELTEMPWW